jgi:hypothetical protein
MENGEWSVRGDNTPTDNGPLMALSASRFRPRLPP